MVYFVRTIQTVRLFFHPDISWIESIVSYFCLSSVWLLCSLFYFSDLSYILFLLLVVLLFLFYFCISVLFISSVSPISLSVCLFFIPVLCFRNACGIFVALSCHCFSILCSFPSFWLFVMDFDQLCLKFYSLFVSYCC